MRRQSRQSNIEDRPLDLCGTNWDLANVDVVGLLIHIYSEYNPKCGNLEAEIRSSSNYHFAAALQMTQFINH